MPPDDLPTDDATEDSTKSPGTKRLIRKERERGAEAEVRGGSAQPDEPPIEQQQRQDRVKGLSLDNRIGRKESMAEEKRNERLRKWR